MDNLFHTESSGADLPQGEPAKELYGVAYDIKFLHLYLQGFIPHDDYWECREFAIQRRAKDLETIVRSLA